MRIPIPDLQEALRRAQQGHNVYALREAYRLQGEVAFASQDDAGAEAAWLAALELAQQSGILLAPFHADLARVCARQGRGPEARALIEQALAEGAPHLEAAEVYLALGERELARSTSCPPIGVPGPMDHHTPTSTNWDERVQCCPPWEWPSQRCRPITRRKSVLCPRKRRSEHSLWNSNKSKAPMSRMLSLTKTNPKKNRMAMSGSSTL